jgi:hypothetical protein
VPKSEATRDIGCAHQIERQELVDDIHCRSLGCGGGGRGKFGLERIASHCSTLKHLAFNRGQDRELFAQ